MKLTNRKTTLVQENSAIIINKDFDINQYHFYISTFCSLTERPMDKIFTEWMLIGKRVFTEKNRPLSKPDRRM